METTDSKCDKCGRVFGIATWDVQSVKEYEAILSRTGHLILCESCTFKYRYEMLNDNFEKDWKGYLEEPETTISNEAWIKELCRTFHMKGQVAPPIYFIGVDLAKGESK